MNGDAFGTPLCFGWLIIRVFWYKVSAFHQDEWRIKKCTQSVQNLPAGRGLRTPDLVFAPLHVMALPCLESHMPNVGSSYIILVFTHVTISHLCLEFLIVCHARRWHLCLGRGLFIRVTNTQLIRYQPFAPSPAVEAGSAVTKVNWVTITKH
jgi:hypothetical protein